MKSKALVKREEFLVKKIKDLFIQHGNHQSKELPLRMRLGGNSHSKDFQDILKENCLGTSLRYLREAISHVRTLGRDLNMHRIQYGLMKIAVLSLIVNEHIERECYLEQKHDC